MSLSSGRVSAHTLPHAVVQRTRLSSPEWEHATLRPLTGYRRSSTMTLMTSDSRLAQRLLGLIDLTSLNPTDTAETVRTLAASATIPAGRVAAICIWARFISVAREVLSGTGIPIAVVANFPEGASDVEAARAETAAAVAEGADEVDVVFPYHAMLAGDDAAGVALVRACRTACGPKTILKVILETGQLGSADHIRHASELAILGGAHFLKTSTGKTQPGATLQAAEAMLDVIASARSRGVSVGFKVSGGVSTIADAQAYLEMYEKRFGPGSAIPGTFRIGASSLMKPVLAALR
ncbi:MAG TPA: deoxyribose-phosphate aldolase [Steroidobacteraceae bacterium]